MVEINDQQENDFISQNLLLQNPTETHYWTGGLTTMLAGIQIGIWHASQNQITFNKFYESIFVNSLNFESHIDFIVIDKDKFLLYIPNQRP